MPKHISDRDIARKIAALADKKGRKTHGVGSNVRNMFMVRTSEYLQRGIIRHVGNGTFIEDPLRVMRAAQLAARYDYDVAKETIELCSKIDLSTLTGERVESEISKVLMISQKPSVFFETLRKMNQMDFWFPELKALIGVEQNPIYHAEGDVWTHTMMVLDEAAKLKERAEKPLWFMFSALSHDMGKAVCSEKINGVIHSYSHEIKGLPIIERFLRRISNDTKFIKYVLNMTQLHMMPVTVAAANSSIKATNRMFDRSVDPVGLICISQADDKGRLSTNPLKESAAFLYERLDIYKEYMSRPFVSSEDLIHAGFEPGKAFSELLTYAHKLRLSGVNKENAMKQVLAYSHKIYKSQIF